jgi:hypothetical protein
MENVSLLIGAGASKYVAGFVTSGLYDAAARLLATSTSAKTLEKLLRFSSDATSIGSKFEQLLSQLTAWRSMMQSDIWPLSGLVPTVWGAPGWMDTQKHECSMKPEVTFGYREEAAAILHA